jgi:hypothetical protein
MTKITDPFVRPYAGSKGHEVLREFEQACDLDDIENAAQAMHELTHRRMWPSQRGYAEDRLVSQFRFLEKAADVVRGFSSATVGKKNVYVVLVRNSRYLEPSHGLYVRMTGLSPEKRLLNHRTGHKSSKVVRKNGVCLLPVLYEKLNPMSDEEARKIESDLYGAFEKAGILSFGGH